MTIPVLQQIITSMSIISGEERGHEQEGRRRIQTLARNAQFFAAELVKKVGEMVVWRLNTFMLISSSTLLHLTPPSLQRKMGFIVYGRDSPVIPLLLFHPAKIPAFSREMLKRGIAVVVVGYPATSIITSRVRFCLSAAHTMDDMKWALQQISEVGDILNLKVSQQQPEQHHQKHKFIM